MTPPTQALGAIGAPAAVVDLDRFDDNRARLLERAGGMPIRVASKSLRVRSLIDRLLATDGYAGILGYSVREAIWLVGTTLSIVFAVALVMIGSFSSKVIVALFATAVPLGCEPSASTVKMT